MAETVCHRAPEHREVGLFDGLCCGATVYARSATCNGQR